MKNSIIRFRYSIIALLMTVINGVGAFASTPWTVNPNDYRYDMSVYLDVEIDSEPLDYSKIEVAAFYGNECRGIAEPLSIGNGKECLYLRVRSNQESGETMSFKYYDKETDKVYAIPDVSINFESNGLIGYPSNPFQIELGNTKYYELTVSAGAGGTVDQTGGSYSEGTVLTITATASEGYRFLHWSDGVTDNPRTLIMNQDITLEAEFAVNFYTLTYVLDGETYKTYSVEYGVSVEAEPVPEKEGYTFSGWTGVPETMPAKDVTVTGSFSVNSYKAVFRIGNTVIETKNIEYGAFIEAPTAPEKEGHTFAGWQDLPETMPAHDIEVTGNYSINYYMLTYVLDGETYKTYSVEYGVAVEAEPAPEKEGYTFSGWTGVPETMPAKDVTVTGSFSVNSYKAVFRIGDTVIETKNIEYGAVIEAPAVPEMEGYTFAGWKDLPETMPAHDIEVIGSYSVSTYTLTYVLDGKTYKSYRLEFGAVVEPEPAPEKEGYTFSGWTGVPETMPAKDVTVTGNFSVNSYKAVFRIGETVIETKTLEFGATIEAPAAPEKEGHTFAGWQDLPETMLAHDIEVIGSYSVSTYTLTYLLDGKSYKTYSVEYGTTVEAEPAPEKEGYTFSGWTGVPETMPAKDVTVTGNFSVNSYNAVFRIGDTVIETRNIEYGAVIEAPTAPEKEGHTFAGWQDLPATMPANDIEIEGSYSVNSYLLSVYLNDELISSEMVEYGSKIEIADPEVPEGMKFDGWMVEIPEYMPAHDVEIYGRYSETDAVDMIEFYDCLDVTVYDLRGHLLYHKKTWGELRDKLPEGLYIINGIRQLIRHQR